MAHSRWDPLQDLLTLHERLSRLAGIDSPGWIPPVDLYETPESYVLTAELPGLTQEDFQVQVEAGKLILRGNRPGASIHGERYDRVERGHGPFTRVFALPQAADADTIRADLKDGVLTVTVPKIRVGERRIDVK